MITATCTWYNSRIYYLIINSQFTYVFNIVATIIKHRFFHHAASFSRNGKKRHRFNEGFVVHRFRYCVLERRDTSANASVKMPTFYGLNLLQERINTMYVYTCHFLDFFYSIYLRSFPGGIQLYRKCFTTHGMLIWRKKEKEILQSHFIFILWSVCFSIWDFFKCRILIIYQSHWLYNSLLVGF